MDMASKDHVNFVVNEPALKYCSHAFTLHIVSFITVVEWNVHENNKPRRLLPINPLQLFTEPDPLRRILYCQEKQYYDLLAYKKAYPTFKFNRIHYKQPWQAIIVSLWTRTETAIINSV